MGDIMERPEWVKCILGPDNKSLCGRYVCIEWMFVDGAHARRTVEQSGRLLPCKECWDRITEVLWNT